MDEAEIDYDTRHLMALSAELKQHLRADSTLSNIPWR